MSVAPLPAVQAGALFKLFASLVRAAAPAAPIAGMVSACSADHAGTRMEASTACLAHPDDAYARLTLGPGADGVEIRRQLRKGVTTLTTLGEICGRSTDKDLCRATVSAVEPPNGHWSSTTPIKGQAMSLPATADFGVVTSGDSVRAIANVPHLVATVIPIDSAEEAAAVFSLSGHVLDCSAPNATATSDGWLLRELVRGCADVTERLHMVHRDGWVTLESTKELVPPSGNCQAGRRPAGLTETGEAWLASLDAHLAEIAYMEAAAILAFTVLEDDLTRLGAPLGLLRRIARARFEEVEHAEIMGALARRYGRTVRTPRAEAPTGERSVFDIALENATEGCVREAYGALIATYQGTYAEDAKLRAAFARIAVDETKHAALSFDVARWLDTRLMPHERARIAAARAEAWRELARECAVEPAPEVVALAGMPRARVAQVLLAGLAARSTQAA